MSVTLPTARIFTVIVLCSRAYAAAITRCARDFSCDHAKVARASQSGDSASDEGNSKTSTIVGLSCLAVLILLGIAAVLCRVERSCRRRQKRPKMFLSPVMDVDDLGLATLAYAYPRPKTDSPSRPKTPSRETLTAHMDLTLSNANGVSVRSQTTVIDVLDGVGDKGASHSAAKGPAVPQITISLPDALLSSSTLVPPEPLAHPPGIPRLPRYEESVASTSSSH